jgi:hypothetical protein
MASLYTSLVRLLLALPFAKNTKEWGPRLSVVSSSRGAICAPLKDVEALLNRLPDDVSVEDIQYHLYVLDKVRRGLEDARVNGTLSQEEVESRFGKWLTE